MISLDDAAAETWSYQYNVLGRLTNVTGPGPISRTWAYEEVSKRLASETHPESGMTRYTGYDDAGMLLTKEDANGTTFAYVYDGNNRVTTITATPTSGPALVTTLASAARMPPRWTT